MTRKLKQKRGSILAEPQLNQVITKANQKSRRIKGITKVIKKEKTISVRKQETL